MGTEIICFRYFLKNYSRGSSTIYINKLQLLERLAINLESRADIREWLFNLASCEYYDILCLWRITIMSTRGRMLWIGPVLAYVLINRRKK